MNKYIGLSVAWVKHVESFCMSIVRRTYPFSHHTSNNETLFLEQAYDARLALAANDLRQKPYSRNPLPLTLWKNFLEIWLSIFFWMAAAAIERGVGNPWGYILPVLVIVYFLYQELYVDAELGRKNWVSTLVDTVLWVVPSLWFIFSLIF